ncbi:MAG: LacI family DNA-binding transcriptional regulator [Acholeplasmatales bacterium]|nr:LacI family DNA-binding transcriptional regulator [Acholeplasmatales bacterium]
MSNATIYDVAGKAEVSLATVSRVLNNPEKVNEATRAKVLKVIKELGYRPNAIARGLASHKTTTVGIMLSDVTRASTSSLLGGIIDIAKKYSYSIKIFSMSGDRDVLDSIREVVAEQVDGILFLNDELDSKQLNIVKEQASNANIPLVLTNVISDDPELASVAIDYKKASYDTTKELIAQGRKALFLLSTVTRYSVNSQKEAGYEEAMKEAGLESKVFRTSGDLSINTPHFEEYFGSHPVDGAIAVRDSIAVSFMNVMINKGKKVPEDVAVIGYQNTKYAMLARPKLTCIDTPVYDIGAVAMRLLTKLMKGEAVDTIKIVLPHKIIKRESM